MRQPITSDELDRADMLARERAAVALAAHLAQKRREAAPCR
jgi:hypothetical protein